MSRSNPTLTNPATRFFEWSGSKGRLEFYDKEKQERINVPLPFSFLPLDELATITGFSSRDKGSYWSNEVRNIKNDPLTVRTRNGVAQEGLYETLADVRAKGAKYAKSIYLVYKTREGWEIGNIKAHGSALSAWIEFSGTCKPQNGKVTITKGDVLQTPKGDDYYPPVFTYSNATPEEDGTAISLDKELQTYLNTYLAAAQFNRGHEDDDTTTPNNEDTDTPTDLPDSTQQAVKNYENNEVKEPARQWNSVGKKTADAEAIADDKAMDAYIDSIQGEQVNLDDIPF